MDSIRVLLVDDHALFRRGIASVLENHGGIELVGEAVNGYQAIEKMRELNPQVILMDLMMPGLSGLEAIEAIHVEAPEINILALTVSENKADLLSAMKFGAKGYVLKDVEPDDLIQAVLHISRGGVIISPQMAEGLLDEFKSPAAVTAGESSGASEGNLSPREKEILQLLATGASNKQIAETLSISENTVKTHMQNIMEKLQLQNRSQATAYAINKGLIKEKK